MLTNWIVCEYDDEGEIINPDFVSAPDDSMWWVDGSNALHQVVIKTKVLRFPKRVSRVWHPDDYVSIQVHEGVK